MANTNSVTYNLNKNFHQSYYTFRFKLSELTIAKHRYVTNFFLLFQKTKKKLMKSHLISVASKRGICISFC